MRVIEEQMIAAIKAGKSKRLGNTEIIFRDETTRALETVQVRLHGHLIAEIFPRTMRVTLAGWGTPTTRSRVNALIREFAAPGSNRFNQRKGAQMFGERTVGALEWVPLPRHYETDI